MHDGPECNECGEGNISNNHVCGPINTWLDWRLKQLGIAPQTKLRLIATERSDVLGANSDLALDSDGGEG